MTIRNASLLLIATGLLMAAPLRAATAEDVIPSFNLAITNHVFEPATLEVPANTKIALKIKNNDSTAEEFESDALNREKVVLAGKEITVNVGPLKPGEYPFFGDFHQKTAQGKLIAK